MKYLLLILSLVTMPVMAKNYYEISAGYARINQELFNRIEFPMDAATIAVTSWHDSGLGLQVRYAQSTETANSLFLDNLHYSNKINFMWSGVLLYKYDISRYWSASAGFGKTDYNSTWKVNGVVPEWGKSSTDSDWSYQASFGYKLRNNFSMSLTYSDLYRKDKEGYGREETKAIMAELIYKF